MWEVHRTRSCGGARRLALGTIRRQLHCPVSVAKSLICKASGSVTAVVHLVSTSDIFVMVLPRPGPGSGRDRVDEFFGLTGVDRFPRGMFV